MSTVPLQPSFGTDTFIKCADLNQLRDGVNYANQMPQVYARQGISGTTMNNVAWSTVGYDTVETDTDGGLNQNGVYTAQTAGWWLVTANIAWPWGNPSAGTRGTRIIVNNTAVPGASLMDACTTIVHGGMLSRMVHLILGDQLEVQGYQDTGKAITTVLNFDAAQGRSETSYLTMNLITADAVQL